MPHIHTNPGEHNHTVSMYIVRTDLDTPHILFHKHKKVGKYMQFGGHIELNETPWQTVIHELQEETGYDIRQLRILQPKGRITTLTDTDVHPQPICYSTHHTGNNHYHTDISYAFLADTPPASALAAGESTDLRLLSRQGLTEMPPQDILESAREITLHIFDTSLQEWEAVAIQ